jgi:hypothetical protein
MKAMIGAVLVAAIVGCFVALGPAMAETAWIDDLANSVSVYKTNYPASNWEPYSQKLGVVRDAVNRGDQRTVKVEMTKWFKMLRVRDHGISDVAADELFNYSLMVTPIQEYGISVPTPSGGVGEFAY